MQSRGFLCPLLCLFLSLLAIGAAPIRQGDALAKFRRETAAAADGGVNAYEFNTLVSDDDLSRRIYDNYGLKEKDKIARLPGQPQGVDFDQYAGYVTVDNRKGRALFYYFAETADPGATSKPLLLWLNGGTGCSSFGYGAMREVGPFRVMSDGKTLYVNPYAWNRVANVLFLESPAGVGFSSSNTTSDYASSGDGKTAEDAYVFLLNWMERFPEYKGRDLYIAGESYAGHYVPQLARTILLHKNLTAAVNLKVIAIGNPVINDDTDYRGVFEFLWTHALISDATVEAIHKFCNFTPSAEEQPKECIAAVEDVNRAVEDLNEYNIYAPLCFSENLTSTPTRPPNDGFDPCTSVYVHAYLNDPDVQKALHANTTNLNHTWSACSHVLTAWLDSPDTILPIIRQLVASQIRVLVYSGDVDGRVPVTSTRYSLNVLKFQVKLPWRAWKVHEEVGGYTTVYGGNLTFATVRGAGHQVSSYQPVRALMLIDSFLRKGVYPLPTIIKIKQIAQTRV